MEKTYDKITMSGKPIWIKGQEKEKNISLGLYTTIEKESGKTYRIKVATAGFYRVFINGNFFYYGPNRCAHGFYRVDDLVLDDKLTEIKNHIAIEVVGYGINSFYNPCQPHFIQVEILQNDIVLKSTGKNQEFKAYALDERVKKIQRYSYQRTFSEAYRLKNDNYEWRIGNDSNKTTVDIAESQEKQLIERGIPFHTFPITFPKETLLKGKVKQNVIPDQYQKDRSLTSVGTILNGYKENELEIHLSNEVQEFEYINKTKVNKKYDKQSKLKENTFEIYEFVGERSGFISLDIKSREDSIIYIMFDEKLSEENDVNPLSMECTNVIKIEAEEGDYNFISFEPYGFKYIKLVCTKGDVLIENLANMEYIYPIEIKSSYDGDDAELQKIYEAARQTFLQNSSDIFMDCPTRERAGWLCDSFFTARAEKHFTGANILEKVFLQNFLLPKEFKGLPKGMLPMCYPADVIDDMFIPNWAMWLVIELEDYKKRTQDTEFVKRFRQRVYDLIDYFVKFENQDGLLESLENWVFVEWSRANEFVQDVNYPSNMLYSEMLKAAGRIFQDKELINKGEYITSIIQQQSYNGEFFVDHSKRENGKLVVQPDITETCQYYAFFFKIATPKSYPQLWNTLINDFGPNRDTESVFPYVYPSNAFIGNYLRLDLLTQYKYKEQCINEIRDYFLYMAEETGTLWENTTDVASCNHGFASYAAYLIEKNI